MLKPNVIAIITFEKDKRDSVKKKNQQNKRKNAQKKDTSTRHVSINTQSAKIKNKHEVTAVEVIKKR